MAAQGHEGAGTNTESTEWAQSLDRGFVEPRWADSVSRSQEDVSSSTGGCFQHCRAVLSPGTRRTRAETDLKNRVLFVGKELTREVLPFPPRENGLFVIPVFSETTVAIAHLWTDHQNPFKVPIKLLQSSGRRKTVLRKKHNNSFDSSTSQITSERGKSRANGTGGIMGILLQRAPAVSSLSHSCREQVYDDLGAAVFYFLINKGAAYENSLVLVSPAGSARLPGPQRAQGSPGCPVPGTGMLQNKGEGKGFLLGNTVPARGKEESVRNPAFVRNNFWLLGCCCCLCLLLAFFQFSLPTQRADLFRSAGSGKQSTSGHTQGFLSWLQTKTKLWDGSEAPEKCDWASLSAFASWLLWPPYHSSCPF